MLSTDTFTELKNSQSTSHTFGSFNLYITDPNPPHSVHKLHSNDLLQSDNYCINFSNEENANLSLIDGNLFICSSCKDLELKIDGELALKNLLINTHGKVFINASAKIDNLIHAETTALQFGADISCEKLVLKTKTSICGTDDKSITINTKILDLNTENLYQLDGCNFNVEENQQIDNKKGRLLQNSFIVRETFSQDDLATLNLNNTDLNLADDNDVRGKININRSSISYDSANIIGHCYLKSSALKAKNDNNKLTIYGKMELHSCISENINLENHGTIQVDKSLIDGNSYIQTLNGYINIENTHKFNFSNIIDAYGELHAQKSQLLCKNIFLNGKSNSLTDSSIKAEQYFATKTDTALKVNNSEIISNHITLKSNSHLINVSLKGEYLNLEHETNLERCVLNFTKQIAHSSTKNIKYNFCKLQTKNYINDTETIFIDSDINSEVYQDSDKTEYKNTKVHAKTLMDIDKKLLAHNSEFITQDFVAQDDLTLINSTIKSKNWILSSGKLTSKNSEIISTESLLLKENATADFSLSTIFSSFLGLNGKTNSQSSNIESEVLNLFNVLSADSSKITSKNHLFVSTIAKLSAKNISEIRTTTLDIHGEATSNQSIIAAINFKTRVGSNVTTKEESVIHSHNLVADGNLDIDATTLMVKQAEINAAMKCNKTNSVIEDLSISNTADVELIESKHHGKTMYVNGVLKQDSTNIEVSQNINLDYLSKMNITKSTTMAKNLQINGDLISNYGHLIATDNLNAGISSEITGEALRIDANTANLDANIKISKAIEAEAEAEAKAANLDKYKKFIKGIHVIANTIHVSYKIIAFNTKLVANNYFYLNGKIISQNIDIDTNNFINGPGGEVTGRTTAITSLSTTLLPGSIINSTNTTIKTGHYTNIGATVAAYNSNISSLTSIDSGLNIPTMPDNIEDLCNLQKVISVSTVLLSNFSPTAGKCLNITTKSVDLISKFYKLPNDMIEQLKKPLSQQYLRHYISPALDATAIARSFNSLKNDKEKFTDKASAETEKLNEASEEEVPATIVPKPTRIKQVKNLFTNIAKESFDFFAPIVDDSVLPVDGEIKGDAPITQKPTFKQNVQNLATSVAKGSIAFFAPSINTESAFSIDGGTKVSYTINNEFYATLDTGYQFGHSIRSQASYNANIGVKRANNLDLNYFWHYNAGKEEGFHELKIHGNNYILEKNSELIGHENTDIELKNKLTVAGKAQISKGRVKVQATEVEEFGVADLSSLHYISPELKVEGIFEAKHNSTIDTQSTTLVKNGETKIDSSSIHYSKTIEVNDKSRYQNLGRAMQKTTDANDKNQFSAIQSFKVEKEASSELAGEVIIDELKNDGKTKLHDGIFYVNTVKQDDKKAIIDVDKTANFKFLDIDNIGTMNFGESDVLAKKLVLDELIKTIDSTTKSQEPNTSNAETIPKKIEQIGKICNAGDINFSNRTLKIDEVKNKLGGTINAKDKSEILIDNTELDGTLAVNDSFVQSTKLQQNKSGILDVEHGTYKSNTSEFDGKVRGNNKSNFIVDHTKADKHCDSKMQDSNYIGKTLDNEGKFVVAGSIQKNDKGEQSYNASLMMDEKMHSKAGSTTEIDTAFTKVTVLQQDKDSNTKTNNATIKSTESHLDGKTEYSGFLTLDSNKLDRDKQSTLHGHDNSQLNLTANEGNFLEGKVDVFNMNVDFKNMSGEEAAHLIERTHEHANKEVRGGISVKSAHEVTLQKVERDQKIQISVTAPVINVVHELNQGRVELEATLGNVNLHSNVQGTQAAIIKARGEINKEGKTLSSTDGTVIVEAEGMLRNANGKIDAPNGTALVTASSIDNTTTDSNEQAIITAKIALVKATDGNVDNTGSRIASTEFTMVTATGNIQNNAREYQEWRGHGFATAYQRAEITGGAGNENSEQIGTYVHADGKLYNGASLIGSTGETVASGDEDVLMESKSNAYKAYEKTTKHGYLKQTKELKSGEATEWGQAQIVGRKNHITSKNGALSMRGVQSLATDGTNVRAKLDILLESVVAREKHRVKSEQLWNMWRAERKNTESEHEKVNIMYTNHGFMDVRTSEGKIWGDGNVFLGGPEAGLYLEGNKGVKLGIRKLMNKVFEQKTNLGFGIAGQSLTDNNNPSAGERLASADPIANSLANLFKSENPLEFSNNLRNTFLDGKMLSQEIAKKGFVNTLKERTNITLSYSETLTKSNYQTAGSGGIFGYKIAIANVPKDQDVELGVFINQVGTLAVSARKFTAYNSQLQHSQKTIENTITASLDLTGNLTFGASHSEQTARGLTQTQGQMNITNLELNVDDFEMIGTKISTENVSGRADRVTYRSGIDTLKSHIETYGGDTNGNFHGANTSNDSSKIGAFAGLHVENGINYGEKNFAVKEIIGYGIQGITTGNPEQNMLVNDPTIKHTHHDLHTHNHSSGGSVSFNVNQIMENETAKVNFGINYKNQKNTITQNGEQEDKNLKFQSTIRAEFEKRFSSKADVPSPQTKFMTPKEYEELIKQQSRKPIEEIKESKESNEAVKKQEFPKSKDSAIGNNNAEDPNKSDKPTKPTKPTINKDKEEAEKIDTQAHMKNKKEDASKKSNATQKVVSYKSEAQQPSKDAEGITSEEAVRFAGGAAAGAVTKKLLTILEATKAGAKFISRITNFGSAALAADGYMVANEFEKDYPLYSADSSEFMDNPFISDDKKIKELNRAEERHKASEAAQKPINLKESFKENPELFGFTIGFLPSWNKKPTQPKVNSSSSSNAIENNNKLNINKNLGEKKLPVALNEEIKQAPRLRSTSDKHNKIDINNNHSGQLIPVTLNNEIKIAPKIQHAADTHQTFDIIKQAPKMQNEVGNNNFGTSLNPIHVQKFPQFEFELAKKQLTPKYNFINESELLKHFDKHSIEFKGTYKTHAEYLNGANFVIENGHKIKYTYNGQTQFGYVRFMSNTSQGEAKFEFLALRDDGSIATYHTKGAKNFYKLVNQNKNNDSVNVESLSCRTM